MFHNFSNHGCHLFLKQVVDTKTIEVKLDIIPMTNQEFSSVTYGFIQFSDIYRFLSSSLSSLVKTLADKKTENVKKRSDKKLLEMI